MTVPPSHSGTYYIDEQYMDEEVLRLAAQDRRVTTATGGLPGGQSRLGLFTNVLDVACGVGHWVLDMAQAYPELALVGIDVDQRMITTATAQAQALNLQERVTFQTMDALRFLNFPDASFDLVHLRFGLGFLRGWEWKRLLANLLRLLRPGGMLRVTEEEILRESTSPAVNKFCELLLCALDRSGHLFTPESSGLTSHLNKLFAREGFEHVQTQTYALHYRANTTEGQAYIEDTLHLLRMLRPFFQHWGCLPPDYEALQQQAQEETARPDFAAIWHLLTVWGSKQE